MILPIKIGLFDITNENRVFDIADENWTLNIINENWAFLILPVRAGL